MPLTFFWRAAFLRLGVLEVKLARVYASCVGEADGGRTLRDETISAALLHHAFGPHRVVRVSSRHASGFQLPDAIGRMLSDPSFGPSRRQWRARVR